MAKKKVQKPRRKVAKHQLSRWQQEKKRRRIILGVVIFIVVAVLGIVGVPWYLNQSQPLHQTVIRVNNASFTMDYYIKTLQIYGWGRADSSLPRLADEVVTVIQENELIRQGAAKLGISVSQGEVDKELESPTRFFPNLPLSKAVRDSARVELILKDKLRDEYFEKQVPVFTEQRHVMAMLLESESQAAEVRARIEGGEELAELARELSLERLSKEGNGDLGWQPKDMLTILLGTPTVDEYAFSSEAGALSQPLYDEEINKNVGYWIAKVLERTETPEQARVLGILLDNEEGAQWIRGKLLAGKDFRTLAEALSEHEWSKEDGGSLGWLTPGEAGPAFDEFVFNPEAELGAVSEPIFDDVIAPEGGYWLIKVEQKKERKEKADVQVILLGTKGEAQEVRARLEAGEDFGELTKELSQDDKSREKSGELMGVAPGKMSSALGEFVFYSEIEVGAVSEPIRDEDTATKGGYWLIKVVDKDDNRQIEDSDRDLLKAEALNRWIEALWDDPENNIESYLDDEKKSWAIEQAFK